MNCPYAFGLLFLWLGLPNTSFSVPCPADTVSSFDKAQAYLRQERVVQNPECTALSLARLSETGSNSTALLARYLDFVPPSVQGFVVLQNDNVANIYPAVKMLAKFGQSSIPMLLEVLKRPDESRAVRRNAARTIKLIYAPHSMGAIEQILKAARAEKPVARQQLEEAAFWLSEWCEESDRQGCSAIYRTYTNPDP